MKHRIFHSDDLEQRLPELAKELQIGAEDLEAAYRWALENEVIFVEGEGAKRSYSISTIDIESRISQRNAKKLYRRLKQDIPSRLVPLFGLNLTTLKDRTRRAWEQWYNILINKIPSHHLRLAWLRLGGARIGKGSSVWRNTEVLGLENLVIGDDTTIGWRCMLDARAGLIIGDHVTVASETMFIAGGHDLQDPGFASVSAPIRVENYAWIATRAMLVGGSQVGRGAVVTANTLVAKSIPPYKIVGGSGARAMGERCHDLSYKVGGKSLFCLFH